MILAHARHGERVTYNVAPSTADLFLTAYRIAFCSSRISSELPPLESRGHPVAGHSSSQLCVPEGGPLYPIDMILVSFVSTAPTCRLIQWERVARFTASSI